MTTNQPAPRPAEAPTSDEQEKLLKKARAAQVAGTFPTDSAIRLLTDDYGWNESERRHCMAAARLALAYWGHAWGCLTTNNPAPAEPADMAVEQLQHIIHREPWATWLRPGGCLESAHCELTDLLSSAIAADRARRAAPPAEGELAELVAWLRETGRLLSRRPDIQCRVDLRLFDRAADLLQQQAAELARLLQQLAGPVAIPGEAYHDGMGPVTWWRFPVEEAPWVGTPGDSDWPGYHTHFTPCPLVPALPEDRLHD